MKVDLREIEIDKGQYDDWEYLIDRINSNFSERNIVNMYYDAYYLVKSIEALQKAKDAGL